MAAGLTLGQRVLARHRPPLVLLLVCLCLMLAVGWADKAAAATAEVRVVSSLDMATASWSEADLQAWWLALRNQEASQVVDEHPDASALPATLLPPEDPTAWRAVRLPDVHSATGNGASAAPVQMRWYRVRVPALSRLGALYMPRVVASSASVLLKTPHGWRVLLDNQPSEREHWAQLLWVTLPAGGAQPLDLVIALPVQHGTSMTVSRLWVGPKEALESTYERRVWLHAGVPQAISFTLGVVAVLALLLWIRAPSEVGHATFALAIVGWLMRNAHHFSDAPTDPTAAAWYWWMTHASLGWMTLLVFITALRFVKEWPRTLLAGLTLAVALATAVSVPGYGGEQGRIILMYLLTASVGAVAAGYVNWMGWRPQGHVHRRELIVIGGAMLLSLVLGGHDLLVLAGWARPEDVYLMPYAALLIAMSFMYAVHRRSMGRVQQAMFQNSQLQTSLDVQADALALQVKRLREAERQQALLLERQRLMADMHDGLGSSLLSALVAVEQGNFSQEMVIEVLRECVDDLRLVIDSLEPVGHDLVSLLATMRYRLGKRLHAGGLKLEWDVHDLPPLPWLEPPDALHVLRLMQEALNNVVKHARASKVRMVTRDHGSFVEIRVEDDGQGFDVQTIRHGRGLKSQVKRAQRLGGKLRVDSTPGLGTRLSLRLPVERREPPGQQGAT